MSTAAPVVGGPASKYAISIDDIGIAWLTDIRQTLVIDMESYAKTGDVFETPGKGRELLRDWGYSDGYQTAFIPEGRDEAVLLGSYYIVVETHRFESEAGARKVYFASAAPAVRYPNVYGIDMPAASELVASGRTEEEVAKFIGADWLVYQDLEDLTRACLHHDSHIQGFDNSCFSGEYVTGDVTPDYLARLQSERSDAAKARRQGRKGGAALRAL